MGRARLIVKTYFWSLEMFIISPGKLSQLTFAWRGHAFTEFHCFSLGSVQTQCSKTVRSWRVTERHRIWIFIWRHIPARGCAWPSIPLLRMCRWGSCSSYPLKRKLLSVAVHVGRFLIQCTGREGMICLSDHLVHHAGNKVKTWRHHCSKSQVNTRVFIFPTIRRYANVLWSI